MTSYTWIVLFAALVLTKAQDFSLEDAFGDDDEKPTAKPAVPPKKDGDEFSLEDAFIPDPNEPKPKDPKPPVVPPKTGGDGFSDSDLGDAANEGYKPDNTGHGSRSGGNAGGSTDTQDDQPQDLYQQWLKLLMLLGDNMPEGLLAWIANSKQVIMSLLERLLELLDLDAAEKQS